MIPRRGRRRARRAARRIHRRFRSLPGAEHIATETAIAGLIVWLRRARPSRVLEVGAGIGTLTRAVLDTLDTLPDAGARSFVTFEDHPFCQQALAENFSEGRHGDELGGEDGQGRATLIDDLGSLAAGDRFDFLIVDGGRQDDATVFGRLARGATIFIEGDRVPQTEALERAVRDRPMARADVRTLRRRRLEDGRWVYDGGYRIYRLEPSLRDRFVLAVIDSRTKLIYRLRPLLGSVPGLGASR